MLYSIGMFFQKVARFCFSRVLGVCWNCGNNCGMNSVMARGYLWCDNCYARYRTYIHDKDMVFNIRYFGRVFRNK